MVLMMRTFSYNTICQNLREKRNSEGGERV